MGKFVKGDVVVVPFPFSDLSASKRRPALVVATFMGDDVILCQITSKAPVISTRFLFLARILRQGLCIGIATFALAASLLLIRILSCIALVSYWQIKSRRSWRRL